MKDNLIMRRAMMGSGVAQKLPSGYSQLEYVYLSDTQVNMPSITLPYDVIIDCVPYLGSYIASIGGYACIYGKNSNFQASFLQNGKAGIGNASSSAVFYEDGKRCTLDLTLASSSVNTRYFVDGVDTGLHRGIGNPVYLGSAGSAYRAKVDIYSLKIIKDGETMLEFVPCKRDNDQKNGFYDIIGEKFYNI